jgi:hypothetical protein
MTEPIPAQNAPYGVNIESGKDLVVRLRAELETAFLRRLAQIGGPSAAEI